MLLSLALDGLLTCMRWPCLHLINTDPFSRVTLCISGVVAPLSAFWDSVLSSPATLASSDSQLSLFNLGPALFIPASSCHLGNLKAVNWAAGGVHYVCFLSLRVHSSLLSDIQCLENCHSMWFACGFFCCFLIVSDRRVNLVTVSPSWSQRLYIQ